MAGFAPAPARGTGYGYGRGASRGYNSNPAPNKPRNKAQPEYNQDLHCRTCNAIGHGYLQCPSVDKEVLPSSSCSQLDADMACLFVSQHDKTDIDMSEASKAIGFPVPFNAMPDPALSNAELPAVSGSLNVLSPDGLTMMFHGMIAVNHGKISVRTLADTGASHCYISQSFVEKAGIPARPLLQAKKRCLVK